MEQRTWKKRSLRTASSLFTTTRARKLRTKQIDPRSHLHRNLTRTRAGVARSCSTLYSSPYWARSSLLLSSASLFSDSENKQQAMQSLTDSPNPMHSHTHQASNIPQHSQPSSINKDRRIRLGNHIHSQDTPRKPKHKSDYHISFLSRFFRCDFSEFFFSFGYHSFQLHFR